jgi:hypothetical protein
LVVLVEARTNLANFLWSPLATNTLTGAPWYFCDPDCTNYPCRFYGLGVPSHPGADGAFNPLARL